MSNFFEQSTNWAECLIVTMKIGLQSSMTQPKFSGIWPACVASPNYNDVNSALARRGHRPFDFGAH